ncbi:MAG: Rieske 2Fe-2S domain-containing protein [Deltaproteobacteria bacterium]|nr:Rieske 2Fe-2S domain-containing protein [Deltaproteobacteria bacterium]MBW2395332.1 Rieske 2Fe-2S domain-containing protein [Deltaproteobacteria bacterium]
MAAIVQPAAGLRLAGTYERTVAASLERVWENVHDWEHLPSLHSAAFCEIELEEQGPWGWRARVQTPPRDAVQELVIELRREDDAERYHARTLRGPGTGADTVTTLTPESGVATRVEVAFWVPVPDRAQAEAIGKGMIALYTQLWDEDEAMMIHRQAFLDGRAPGVARPGVRASVALGAEAELRTRLPVVIDVGGEPFRILEVDGALVAHSTVCPHLGGPLDDAAVEDGHVICPWHGYRFSLRDGSNPEHPRCRMLAPAQIEVDASGDALLTFGQQEPS